HVRPSLSTDLGCLGQELAVLLMNRCSAGWASSGRHRHAPKGKHGQDFRFHAASQCLRTVAMRAVARAPGDTEAPPGAHDELRYVLTSFGQTFPPLRLGSLSLDLPVP